MEKEILACFKDLPSVCIPLDIMASRLNTTKSKTRYYVEKLIEKQVIKKSYGLTHHRRGVNRIVYYSLKQND